MGNGTSRKGERYSRKPSQLVPYTILHLFFYLLPWLEKEIVLSEGLFIAFVVHR